VRVIYYFHSEKLPLLALDIYGKNEQESLTASQRKQLRALVSQFIEAGLGEK
jgi:hypothetical protein